MEYIFEILRLMFNVRCSYLTSLLPSGQKKIKIPPPWPSGAVWSLVLQRKKIRVFVSQLAEGENLISFSSPVV